LADDGSVYALDQPVMVLGRDPSCQVVIDEPRVSLNHAEIQQQGGDYVLADLNSSNGTFVNGQRLVSPVTLQPGDRIGLGVFGLSFQAALGQAMQSPVPVGDGASAVRWRGVRSSLSPASGRTNRRLTWPV
jgi:pSer/pThr/pTyr-binding forkhead associated (FHA) protein